MRVYHLSYENSEGQTRDVNILAEDLKSVALYCEKNEFKFLGIRTTRDEVTHIDSGGNVFE